MSPRYDRYGEPLHDRYGEPPDPPPRVTACGDCLRYPPRPQAAPALHCTVCDRHLGKTRAHFMTQPAGPDSAVLCVRCAEQRRPAGGSYAMASRAAAAKRLGLWP